MSGSANTGRPGARFRTLRRRCPECAPEAVEGRGAWRRQGSPLTDSCGSTDYGRRIAARVQCSGSSTARGGEVKTPKPTVCGAYKLDVSAELFSQAMQWKYEGLHVDREAEDRVRDEVNGVVLLDVRIDNCDERFRIDDFGQPGSDQAPYLEVFLTPDGTAIAPEPTGPINGETIRVAFYLHFFDERQPLITSYGPVPVPATGQMPSRLRTLAPYEPVT